MLVSICAQLAFLVRLILVKKGCLVCVHSGLAGFLLSQHSQQYAVKKNNTNLTSTCKLDELNNAWCWNRCTEYTAWSHVAYFFIVTQAFFFLCIARQMSNFLKDTFYCTVVGV